MSKLQSPDSSMQEYKTNQHNQHRDLTEKLIQVTNNQLETYVRIYYLIELLLCKH